MTQPELNLELVQFIRDHRGGDRLNLLLQILSRWPTLRDSELQAAIDAVTLELKEGGR